MRVPPLEMREGKAYLSSEGDLLVTRLEVTSRGRAEVSFVWLGSSDPSCQRYAGLEHSFTASSELSHHLYEEL